jgi:outer membrane biogenesis lipoprotein LolB
MKTIRYIVIAIAALAATPASASIALNSSRSNVARQAPAGKSAIDNWQARGARGISSDTSPLPQDRRVHTPIKIVRHK